MDDQAHLLGPLLVEQNLLVPEQLDLALQFAERTGLPLDRIVVAEFAVPQPDISRLLALVSGEGALEESDAEAVASAPPVRPLGFRIRRPIGQIFVDLGFITTDDREAALEVQRENGGLLGEILIQQGKLTRLELANALSEHWDSQAQVDESDSEAPAHRPSLVVVPPPSDNSSSLDASALAELRRSLDELEAARAADARAAEERIAAIDETLAALGAQDDDEFRQATSDRLQELATKIESVEVSSTGAVDLDARLEELATKIESVEVSSTGAIDLDARLHALAGSTFELRSELEALAARQPDAEPNETVNELKQNLDTLAQTMDDRLATLATDLRAETTTRTDDVAAQLRAQTDELATSIAALHETLGANHAQTTQHTDAWNDESRGLAARIDGLDESRQADADAAKTANDQLHQRLDELIALRTTDLETTQAAQAEAAHATAETTRIEEALRSELAALAARRADGEQTETANELKQAIDALAQTMDDRLATLAGELRAETAARNDEISSQLGAQTEKVEQSRAADAKTAKAADGRLRERLDELIALQAAELEATQAAQAQAAADASSVEQALRSELEALAARQPDAEPNETVNELKQNLDTLAQTMDDRLATLATDLRAETTTRTDDVAAQLRAQTDELATSIAALHETLGANHAQTTQHTDAWNDESRGLAARIDGLDESRQADADAAKTANDQLHQRLDELIALRTTDLETTQAAQAEAAHATAETTRIEHSLVGALAELAVQVDDLANQLTGQSAADAESQPVDREPGAEPSDDRGSQGKKKRSKHGKSKKTPKR